MLLLSESFSLKIDLVEGLKLNLGEIVTKLVMSSVTELPNLGNFSLFPHCWIT